MRARGAGLSRWRGLSCITSLLLFCATGCVDQGSGEVASLATELRPDTPDESTVFHFDEGDVIETYDTPHVRVHFTRAGRHAVRATDADMSGESDLVEAVGEEAEAALVRFEAMSFRMPLSDASIPDNGGDGRTDVYLVDFVAGADGAYQSDACEGRTCRGYLVVENDFGSVRDATAIRSARVVVVHELFHAVQAAYDATRGPILGEGTAVWSQAQVDPELDEVGYFAGGYLTDADRPLDIARAGAVLDPFTYGAGIFFQFLSERYADDAIVALWQRCADSPDDSWLNLLDDELSEEGATYVAADAFPDAHSFAGAFVEFARWNLQTGPRAPDSAERAYARAASLSEVEFEEVRLPLIEERPRTPRASARYLRIDRPTGPMAYAFGADGDASGLRVLMAARTDEGIVFAPDGATVFDPAGATEAFAVLVNTQAEGPSSRASFCLGTEAQVEACAAFGDAGMPDAGTDAGTSDVGVMDAGASDAAVSSDGGVDGGMSGSGGGCSASRSAGSGQAAFSYLLLLGWVVRRRRR